ncbi:hypothetical protein EDD16DRAFT_1589255, partial [Pisolithus croceorrhizus]
MKLNSSWRITRSLFLLSLGLPPTSDEAQFDSRLSPHTQAVRSFSNLYNDLLSSLRSFSVFFSLISSDTLYLSVSHGIITVTQGLGGKQEGVEF